MTKRIREVFDRIASAAQVEEAIPDDIALIELADMVVHGKVKLNREQMRMLIELLPYNAPKLAVVGHIQGGEGFARRLDECIERSSKVQRKGPVLLEDKRFEKSR